MRFRREMKNTFKIEIPEKLSYKRSIKDIPMHKSVTLVILNTGQIFLIGRIGKSVKVHNPHVRILFEKMQNKMAADETGASRNQDRSHRAYDEQPSVSGNTLSMGPDFFFRL